MRISEGLLRGAERYILLDTIILSVAHIISIKQEYIGSVTIEYVGSESGPNEGSLYVASRSFSGAQGAALWAWFNAQAIDLLEPQGSH